MARSTRPARARFSRVQVLLHWTTAALVLFQFLLNDDIRRGFRDRLGSRDVDPSAGASFHIACGMLILGLTFARLAVRLAHGAPPPAERTPSLLEFLAALVHWALYALLLLMPITGAIAWFGRVEAAAVLHEIGRMALLALVLAHVFGALIEHFVIGNRAIRRML